MKTQDNLVHPEDSTNISYWTKKWGISIRQLNDAILNTGSLNPQQLRAYLKKDVYSPFSAFTRLFKSRIITVH